MPELPEIETVRRDLEKSLLGAQIIRAKADDPLIIPPAEARKMARVLKGQTIETLGRCGKVLVISVSGGWSVLQRFGMTGQMYPLPAGEPLPPHLRMIWDLADGRRLVYRDARRFGETRLVKTADLDRALGEDCRLGHDALLSTLSAEDFAALLADHSVPIKNFLLDQTHLAGIGNIYASEILHRCRIHPETPANALTPPQARLVLRVTREVLAEAVAAQGTTISDYRTGENLYGGFQKFLRVYGRAGETCLRRGCGGQVERIVQGGRSTFFCPRCQK
jgi:formamidopyrimidine-DNA glycosylase